MPSLYFDNAATSFPKPGSVYRAVADSLIKCGGNPGRSTHKEAENSAKTVFEAREAVSGYFNVTEANKVFFTLNATSAINTAVLGLSGFGGEFVISDVEHNAVVRSVSEKCKRENASRRIFKTDPCDKDKTVRSFEEALSEKTRCVVLTGASNVDGRILPLKEIGNICRNADIPLIIDASQLAGHGKIDMSEIHCSVLCCAGHKGLYSPMGCGFGIIGDIDAEFSPLTFGGNGINSKDIFVGNEIPERYESGTVAVPNIAGLLAGVRYLEKHGETLNEIVDNNVRILVDGLVHTKGIHVYHACGGVPVISIMHDNIQCEDIAYKLAKSGFAVRAGFHCAPLAHHTIGTYESGTVRISPSAFNSEHDCRNLIRCIEKIVCE